MRPYALMVSSRPRPNVEAVFAQRIGIPLVQASYEDFVDRLRAPGPSLLVLELADDDGRSLAALKLLAATSAVPLLALVGDEAAGIQDLQLGADAISADPVDPEGLAARIEALLRRLPAVPVGSYRDPVLELDRVAHYAAVEGEEVALTPTEFKLLFELASGRGAVLGHEVLLERVWGDRFRDPGEVKTYVSYLRRKLGPAAACIENVRGVGYRYRAPLPARDLGGGEAVPARRR